MKRPLRILTPVQMRAVDGATEARGIPGLILMENAAAAVVRQMAQRLQPLQDQRIVVVCGKGNNGGDGLAIARQLHVAYAPRELHVVLIVDPAELKGDAATNLAMLRACGLRESSGFPPQATVVVDAILGTGLTGAAGGEALEAIRTVNSRYAGAHVVAVDVPSGIPGNGEFIRADSTVTFTAPKPCHALPPFSALMGELSVAAIGSAPDLLNDNADHTLGWITPEYFAPLFAPRPRDSNKGRYGHALIVAGAPGKPGAAAMAGMSALRAGAGLVTVAAPESVRGEITAACPELMTESIGRALELALSRTVTAIGPGLGVDQPAVELVRSMFAQLEKPLIADADALNCLVGSDWRGGKALRVITPHPGEMARLTGLSIPEVQSDRMGVASKLAIERICCVVLKGEATVVAWPDGETWINPTGTPAMSKAGSGDVLTGLLAGFLAQFPQDAPRAIAAAVWLHGRAGELAARDMGEHSVLATDLLRYLPEGLRGIANLHHAL